MVIQGTDANVKMNASCNSTDKINNEYNGLSIKIARVTDKLPSEAI